MQKNQYILYILLIYAVIASSLLWIWPDHQKIAYVESAKVIESYPGAQAANEKLEKEIKGIEDTIKDMQTKLDSLNMVGIKFGERWSKNKQQEFQVLLQQKAQELQQYSQTAQQQINQRQQVVMQPVYNEIDKLIAEYAEAYGYAIIMGVLQGNIVYGAKRRDITDDVVKWIKER